MCFCHSLLCTESVTHFWFCNTQRDPRHLWPLRHLIRVMRKHDLTNRKTKTKIFREHPQMTILNINFKHYNRSDLTLAKIRNSCDVLSHKPVWVSAVAAIRPALFLRLTLRHALPGQWTSVGARNWQDQDSFFLNSLNTFALFSSSLGGHYHFEMWRLKRASLWQFKSFGLSFWQGVRVCTGVGAGWVGMFNPKDLYL